MNVDESNADMSSSFRGRHKIKYLGINMAKVIITISGISFIKLYLFALSLPFALIGLLVDDEKINPSFK